MIHLLQNFKAFSLLTFDKLLSLMVASFCFFVIRFLWSCNLINSTELETISIDHQRTYGTNSLQLIGNPDITQKIMKYQSPADSFNLGICSKASLSLFNKQISSLKERMENIDDLVQMLSAKMDFIDAHLLRQRLKQIPCYLSS